MTRQIVLASGNRGKLAELAALLAPLGAQVLPLSQFTSESAEECGETFVENALLKARHASAISGLPAIADDSGLEVDALCGAPGVRSARYAGVGASDEANNRKLLQALDNVADAHRTARFRCVLALVRAADDPNPVVADAAWEGRILRQPVGERGFGYDPLFQPHGLGVSSAQLSTQEKNRISHRGLASVRLLQMLQASDMRWR